MSRTILNIIGQSALLWIVFRCGALLVRVLHLTLPGNVAGMLIMFALLASGVVKPSLIEDGANFLLKHFAFFFIPISVGLMAFTPLMRQSGAALLTVLTASAMVGLAVAGISVTALEGRKKR